MTVTVRGNDPPDMKAPTPQKARAPQSVLDEHIDCYRLRRIKYLSTYNCCCQNLKYATIGYFDPAGGVSGW